MSEEKVAIFIDDDAKFLSQLAQLIHHPHYEIKTHHTLNGYRVIDELLRIKPDVLFIDFYLPRANGGQILNILKSVKGFIHVPIYFITAYSEPEILPFLKDLDYDGVIPKSDALGDAVFHVLDRLEGASNLMERG